MMVESLAGASSAGEVGTSAKAEGILNIYKQAGWTSFDVVARVRSLTGVRRVGHAGTLDPDATGVLLVCLGRATKFTGMLSGIRKVYRAEVMLGAATDTYDGSGRVVRSGDWSAVTREEVMRTLPSFLGRIEQQPPMYSAVKVGGRRLYDLARKGLEVDRPVRSVEVFRIELRSWAPPQVVLEIECGKGTYIRSIADDLGKRLKCGAHVGFLERTACGTFLVADSITIGRLEAETKTGEWLGRLIPLPCEAD